MYASRKVVDDRGIRNKGAARHPQGLKDGAPHIVRKRFTLRDLQRVPHHRDPGVRVLRACFRLVDQRGPVQACDRGREIGAGVVEVVARGRFPDEPRAVRHELAQRDGHSGTVVGCEVGEVAPHRRVDVDLAPLRKLHDREVREELGNRAHSIQGLRRGRNPRRLFAETLCPDDALRVHQRDGNRRKPLLFTLALDHRSQALRHLGIPGALRGLRGRLHARVSTTGHGEEGEEQEADDEGSCGPGVPPDRADTSESPRGI